MKYQYSIWFPKEFEIICMNLLKPTARCFRFHLGKSRAEYGISVYLFLRKLPSIVWESICLHPWVRKQAQHPKPLLQEAMISSPCLAAKGVRKQFYGIRE